ncbi:glycosyltransferase family 4 protein [Campylobacter sp. MOP7]|uniref:glycosyltransferase family 4 protein n=1 Tax=Campylobacter canis TaxID=3378588 RepID=UPI00387E25BA
MRVVQILPELNEGGVERGTIELAKEFDKNNIESFIISGGGNLLNQLKNSKTKHIRCNVFSKNILTFIPRVFILRRILRDISPDIVHVRSRFPAWILYFAKHNLNFKIVSTVHGLNSPNCYSKIMTKADRIICVSNYVKNHVIKHFKTPTSKIKVIFRGVDLSNFDPKALPDKYTIRENFGYKKDDFIIACVGRISQTKNIQTLIKAVSIIKRTHPNIKALIVGSVHKKRKKYFEMLLNIRKELKVEQNVIFTGNVNNISQIYKLCDVIISPSIKPESFGRSIAEAISINTPVVASNHGGVKDIIIENTNGYFFEPTDENELAKKILKAKGLKFDGFNYISKTFNLANMSKDTIELYKEILSE